MKQYKNAYNPNLMRNAIAGFSVCSREVITTSNLTQNRFEPRLTGGAKEKPS